MSRTIALPILTLIIALVAVPATAQNRGYAGAFERVYPEAADLLYGIDEVNAQILDELFSDRGAAAGLEGESFGDYRREILDGADRAVPAGESMPGLARAAPRLAEIYDRTNALRRELYDIYADPQLSDRYGTAEQAIDRYLTRPEAALPPTPKSFMIMHEQPYSMAFRMRAPRTNGVIWASNWLQYAVFDPMMYYGEGNERADGMQRVIDRFEELMASSPESTPQEMPTPAAISPELTRTHPRAAAIFDNLNMLHELVADLLANADVADRQTALNDALRQVTNGEHMMVSNYDWLVGSLRHGIFYQGGPAIGRLDRPERNIRGGHGEHGGGGQMVMPGMPAGTTGGGGGPSTPAPDAGDQPDQGVDHTQH